MVHTCCEVKSNRDRNHLRHSLVAVWNSESPTTRTRTEPFLSVAMACMSKLFAVTNGSVLNLNSPRCFSFRFTAKIKMSSDALPPLPENRIVVGYGMTTVDFLATVDGYPKPDDKVRSSSLKVEGGGNAGNALTCAARLGLQPKLISKVADDAHGFAILKELEADGVDTSFIVVSRGGSSTFSYVLVDNQTKTRTSIYTPGDPPMMPDDLSESTLLSAFDGARLVYFDGMFPETALFIAQEAWTQAPSIPSALVSMLLRLPNINFVIVTLGEDGCLMLERSANEDADIEERDVESFLEFLCKGKDDSLASPTCIPSGVTKFRANGIGTICGKFYIGTAEKIPDSELIDTTGAGDAFIGAIVYAICANMVPEKMLPFAAQVAAAKCRALGARTGLPLFTNRGNIAILPNTNSTQHRAQPLKAKASPRPLPPSPVSGLRLGLGVSLKPQPQRQCLTVSCSHTTDASRRTPPAGRDGLTQSPLRSSFHSRSHPHFAHALRSDLQSPSRAALPPFHIPATVELATSHPTHPHRFKGSMFYLNRIEHKLPLPPSRLVLPIREAIHMELEKLFLDKVIANLGLCISIYDIRSIDGGFIFPGDGAPTYTVVFNLIMFRPFVGEIITARLLSSDVDGLRLTLGFFDDLYVPAHHLPYPNHFLAEPINSKKGVWFWDFNEQSYPIEDTDVIKFRVQNVSYPPIPIEQPKESKPFAPMLVTGSLDHDGLGLVSWWFANEVFLIALSLLFYVIHSVNQPLNIWDLVAIFVCLSGIVIAYIADAQLYNFVSINKELKEVGKPVVPILDKGLWYCCRHSNCFGKQVWWWGLVVVAWNLGHGWTFIGALANTMCLAYVTKLVKD
ncbi:DNA-directed RNA polymerase III subunit RPC8 [Spatholobus suberectus]|nr:DNA-directed RNA polymerase III subunit RPC8 [Spatholobus suberectus]